MEEAPKPSVIQMTEISDVHDVHVVDRNGTQAAEQTRWLCCTPCHWLRRNNSVHKASLTIVSLLVMSILVASPVLFLISSAPAGDTPFKDCFTMEEDECFPEPIDISNSREICDTTICRDLARRIQFSIMWLHDPCKDFYKFACGGWLNSKTKAPSHGSTHQSQDLDLSFATIQNSVDITLQQLLVHNATGKYAKLGVFYDSCMKFASEKENLTPMYALLEELGGYLPPGSLGPSDMTFLMAALLKVNGAPLLDIYIDRDLKNRSQVAIFIDLPRTGGLLRLLTGHRFHQPTVPKGYYSTWGHAHGNNIKIKRQVRTESESYSYIKDVGVMTSILLLENIASGMLPKGISSFQREMEIQSMVKFAVAIDQLLPRKKEIFLHLQDNAILEEYTVVKLRKRFPFLRWKILINEILPEGISIENQTIYVMYAEYLKDLGTTLQHFENRVVQNAMLALYARDFLFDVLNQTGTGYEDRAKFCTHLTAVGFGYGMSALYLTQYSQHYLNRIKETVSKMFDNLKSALYGLVEKANWVDSRTKSLVLAKIEAINGQFTSWPPLSNSTFIVEMFQQMDVTDNFFDNLVKRHRYLRNYSQDIFNQSPDNQTWPYPFIVNAFYEPIDNSVVVPLALLTQPQASAEAPLYISYANTGAVLAHELLHSLDRRGVASGASAEVVEYDDDYDTYWNNTLYANAFYDLWTNKRTYAELERRTDCLAKQHASHSQRKVTFLGNDVDVEFDWNVTSEENTADVVGTRVAMIAWRALSSTAKNKKGGALLPGLPMMTRKKLFYLANAQMYCASNSPEEYIIGVEHDFHTFSHERVNGVIRNSIGFAEAYGCPNNSPMNPEKKCLIW